MNKNKLFVFLCILTAKLTLAQVNLQSGSAEQTFPLINYQDSKSGLAIGVSASYASGNGLMVNDVASNLGTGWTLDAGGMISRVQIGQPDDQKEFTTSSQTTNVALLNYPNGYMYSNAVNKGCNTMGNYYPVFKERNTVYKNKNSATSDIEQDRFVFRFNGKAGSFIIGRDWKVTTIGDSRMKIEFTTSDLTSQYIRTTIDQFVITTEDGVQYTFRTKGLSRILRYKYSQRDQQGNFTPIEGNTEDAWNAVNRHWGYELGLNENPFIVSTWFLSEIKNTNNGYTISFEYEGVKNDIIATKNVSQTRDLNNTGKIRDLFANSDRKKAGEYWYSLLSNPENAIKYSWDVNYLKNIDAGPIFLQYVRSVIQSQRLTRIVLPNGGYIRFKYHPLQRVDLPGENAISKVEYVLNGKLLRAYQFEYGYFFRNAIRPYDHKFNAFESKFARLCLLTIQKLGNGEDNAAEPPYTFSYYTGSLKSIDDMVPARNFLAKDHWGYYNGSISGLPLSEDHDFLSDEGNNYFKAVLPSMHNPKAGYAKNGLLHTVTYPTGGSIEYIYDQNKASASILPYIPFRMAGGVSVVKTVLYNGEDHAQDIINEYKYIQESGISSRWGDEIPNYTSLTRTDYRETFLKKRFKYPGIEYPEMAVSSDASKFWANMLLGTAVGIVVNVGIATTLTALGAAGAIPYVNIAIAVAAITKMIIDLTKTFEFHRFVLSNVNYTLINPLTALYSRVEVMSNSPNLYNGKTVYEYTDYRDFPLLVPKFQWPFVQGQRSAGWAYGLLKKITVFNKENKRVSESSNDYQYIAEKIADDNNINCNCATQRRLSFSEPSWSDEVNNYFTWSTVYGTTPRAYYAYTGRTDLVTTTEKSYVNGNLYYSAATRIIPDPATLLQKGTVVQRDQNSMIMKMSYYANDFEMPGALQRLKANNAIHTPVATETWLMKLGATPSAYSLYLIDASVTEYNVYTFNGRQEVKPWKTYTLKTKEPIPSAVIGMHNKTVLLRKPEYYKQTGEMVYDSDGNLVQMNSLEQTSSFVNDYAGRYVIASVVNSTYNDIAYTSFEADGNGSWNLDARFIRQGGVTGSKAFFLGYDPALQSTATLSRSNLNNAMTYLVTYWKVGNSAAINGQAGQLLYESTNGWRLYQHEVSGTASITISGDASLIDEVRLYPKGALMSTVTYKEGIGKTAECDANNRLMFYEYDALGRLKLIRDQNKNIIKTYEYNYKK